ncbi:PEPxxWA-CTERM sorting domain-containing protein [Sphingomonas sp.]|jgi:hypothetical protein|uniref:PEPxxWA-CTERM sorting domain-containing protein n=1 Tax=Sphingomonas sp. TaxID=28214 RepID=UPI002DF190F3|nr:PEPxxWA-CTERM sorting domain-containing protein [Sphingomonas sp.]
MRNHLRLLAASCTPVVALSLLGAAPAAAALPGIKETATVQNQYGFAAGSGTSFVPKIGGEKETFYVADTLPTESSEVGVNYIGTADVGNFFFLHDNYAVGAGTTFSETVITFTLTNENDGPVALRFDSLITPGHIAHIRGGGTQRGSFDFRVVQSFGVESDPITLYAATGGVNSDGAYLNTGNLVFNGLTETFDPDERWEVIDWSATALSIPLLQIAGGQTTQISYIASYQTYTDAVCQDVLDCAGLQVVFGDPRNDGGVSNITSLSDFGPNLVDEGVYPVIGRNYDAYRIPFAFVPLDAPRPEQPGGEGPIKYGALFDPRAQAVPEPTTWAMMIGGFGLIGGAARRRRVVTAAA